MGGAESKTTPVQTDELVSGPMTHDCYKYYELQISEGGKILFTCDGCKMNGIGPRYVCTLCDNTLHKGCMHPKPTFSLHYFQGSTFKFTQTPDLEIGMDNRCAACREPVCGFSYQCEATKLSLHPACCKLDKKICFDDKIFNLCTTVAPNCSRCHKFMDRGLFYVSSGKDQTQFHIHCFVETIHDSYIMEHEDIHSSSTTINKAETPEVDLSNVFETKMKTSTPEKIFVEFLTDEVDTNSPEKEEAETTKPGILGKISNFFKTMYHKVISGVKVSSQKVWNAARKFSFKITSLWCDKIADFFEVISDFSKAMLPYLKSGSIITSEILHKLSKTFDLNFTLEQCQKIQALLELALNILRGPIPRSFG